MKKYLKWIFLAMFTGFIVFTVKLPSIVKNVAINKLEEGIERRVEAGRLRYNYARNILYVEDFKIYEEDRKTLFAYFEFFNVNIDIIHLLKGDFYIRELSLINPNLRIEYDEGRGNFESIIESIGREKKEEAEGEEEEGFIKRVELKNVKVESFVLHYEDRIIKGENDFTLETPQIVYENGIFTLASTIDFYKSGRMDLDIEYRENGRIEGRIKTEKLLLDDKLYIIKALYELEKMEGIIDSELEFHGDLSTGDYTVSGTLDARELGVDSVELGELFYLERLEGDIEEIRPAQKRYALKDAETAEGRIDIVKIMAYMESLQKPEGEEVSDTQKDTVPLDLRVDSFRAAKVNLTTAWGRFTGLEGEIQGFTGRKGNKFPLNLSFIHDGDTGVKIKSMNTLKEGMDIGAETILSAGNLEITGKHMRFLENFLPEERSNDFSSDTIKYETDYDYAYPALTLVNTLVVDNIELKNLVDGYPLLRAGHLATTNSVEYSFEDGNYKIAGDMDLKGTFVADDRGKKTIEGRSLTAKIKELQGEVYILDELKLEGWRIDLGNKGTPEEGSKEETGAGEYPTVNIGNLGISDTSLTLNKFILGIDAFKGGSIGTVKGSSDIEFQGTYNGSPVKIDGRLGRDRDIKKASDTDYLTFRGRGEISSLNLEDVDAFLKEDYKLKGAANIKSVVNYSKDRLDTKNSISLTGGSMETKEMKIVVESLTSENKFTMAGGRYTLDGKISLNMEEMNFFYEDEEYKVKGYADIKSRFKYFEDEIDTKNFIFLEGVSVEGTDLKVRLGSFTWENNFTMVDGRYTVDGKAELNKAKIDIDGTGITLEEGDVDIVKVSPDEIRLKLLHLTKPRVRMEGKDVVEQESIEVETEDEDRVKKAVEERSKRPLVAIEKFILQGGRVDYRAPNFRYSIKNILVDVDKFTTEKDKEFQGRMSGGLTGTGRVEAEFISSLERSWDFNPTSLNIDGSFDISNLDLLDFREYLSTKLPNEIDSGKLYYKGDVRLDKGKFQGENLITVKTVYIGDNTEVKSVVPLKLAVNILKDRRDTLELDVPVSGDFNDPRFGVYRVVLHAIKNILIKAATSPVNILTKTFRIGRGKVIALEYEYLSTIPKTRDRDTLKKVAEMMDEKEGVDVVFTLFTNREEEKRVLNEKLREEKFFKRDTKDEELEEQVDEIMSERKQKIEDYFRSKLLEKRVRVEVSDIPREKAVSNIDFIITE